MKYFHPSFDVFMQPDTSHPKAGDWDQIFKKEKPTAWTKIIRETGLVEYVCEHGVGHPDPESAKKMGEGWGVHGCDGCCSRDDFPGEKKAYDLD